LKWILISRNYRLEAGDPDSIAKYSVPDGSPASLPVFYKYMIEQFNWVSVRFSFHNRFDLVLILCMNRLEAGDPI